MSATEMCTHHWLPPTEYGSPHWTCERCGTESAEGPASPPQDTAVAQLEARIAQLQQALAPFAAFAKAWDAKPLSALGDEFYGIHTGTEWAASLRLSDVRRARAVLDHGEGV